MYEHTQKCENLTLKLSIALKMAYSCRFGFKGNLDFPDFLQKKFITSITELQYGGLDNVYVQFCVCQARIG